MVQGEPLLGLDVASTSVLFLAILTVHVAAASVAIVSGIVAMVARKGSGRHSRAGHWYLIGILVVFATACALAAFRWPEDLPLVVIGGIGAASAVYGFAFRRLRRPGDIPHILAMGISYIAMLTAFYVDNGPQLPVWNLLPPLAFWVIPAIVGAPIIGRAIWKRRHPHHRRPLPEDRVQQERP
ncbi:hypothetical protein [Sinomonas sp. G460-2]|uniref:hypothetical protein n=1 Tax=Sinomonas sp. G460-2 TaxID=3393464 RepID=UPI0039F03AD8